MLETKESDKEENPFNYVERSNVISLVQPSIL